MSRSISRAPLAAMALTLVAWLVAPAAFAHAAMVESNPESGSRIGVLPTTISLRFNSPVTAEGAALVVTQDDKTVSELNVKVSGDTVSAPAPTSLKPGIYAISWRAVAGDGHPLTGSIVVDVTGSKAPNTDPNKAATKGLTTAEKAQIAAATKTGKTLADNRSAEQKAGDAAAAAGSDNAERKAPAAAATKAAPESPAPAPAAAGAAAPETVTEEVAPASAEGNTTSLTTFALPLLLAVAGVGGMAATYRRKYGIDSH